MKRDDLNKKDKVISCAECRRLKLKCDRQFPCSSCRRRGLAALCPESSLITRPRKNPQINKKTTNVAAKMSERIKQLEEALASIQNKYAEEPHPLLADPDSSDAEDEVTGLEEPIGTLAINPESGSIQFLGHSAGMESFYHHELPSDVPKRTSRDDGQTDETVDLLNDSVLYPLFISVPESSIREHLNMYLPKHEEASRLRDIYYKSASWMYSSMSQEVVQGVIFDPVYRTSIPTVSVPSYTLTHAATLFASFAIASSLDLRKSNSSVEDITKHRRNAAQFYKLARAALAGEPSMLGNPTLSGIRVLMLMAFYHMLLDDNDAPETVWSLLSLATGMAVNMGLHRNSKAWNLPPAVVTERRSLLWQIVRFNSFQGLAFGKPTPLARKFIDCDINPNQPVQLPNGRIRNGDRYRIELMASTILPEFAEFVLSSSKHKYNDVLLIDRKLRDCAEEVFEGPVGSLNFTLEDLRHGNIMCNFYVMASKEALSIYLHRNYFVRVCSIPSSDYLRNSRHSPSFFAALRSAQVIIKLLGFLLELDPDTPSRFWVFWNHALASAIIVGSIVIQHPRCVLAAEAMVSMEAIYSNLCQWAARNETEYDRPKRALKSVALLREKARRALETGISSLSANSEEDSGISLGLSLLAGSARVVRSSNSKSSSSSAAAFSSATSSSAASSPPSAANVGELHPTLLEDMNSVLGPDWENRFPIYAKNGDNNTDIPMRNSTATTRSPNANMSNVSLGAGAGASASASANANANASATDSLGGLSPNQQQQNMYQTLIDFQSIASPAHNMYQNQVLSSNQSSVPEFDIDNLRQSQSPSQPQLQPQMSMPAEMLTDSTSYYGYPVPVQQMQAQAQAQADGMPSWSDMMQGYANVYQAEETYPLVDDGALWQNLVAGLGILT